MPNWCQNRLMVSGSSEELKKFVEFAEGPENMTWKDDGEPEQYPSLPSHTLLSLPKLVPPGEAAAVLRWDESTEQYAKRVDWQARDGEEWELENWGTRWGVIVEADQRTIKDGVASYEFQSAWSPISAALRRFAPQWPELNFRLEFIEEGWGIYGETEYASGKLVRDYAIDVQHRHVQAFYRVSNENLPAFLKEHYGMTDEEVSKYLADLEESRVVRPPKLALGAAMQSKPSSKGPNAFEEQIRPIATIIRRLARVNGCEIGPNKEHTLGYCVGQLTLLAQKIQEHDSRSDLSGYAALPRLLHELCGSELKHTNANNESAAE